MMERNAIEVFRRSTLWFLWIWLAFAGAQAFAATTAVNTATIAPPAGVTDTVGGCDSATPPNCTGNKTLSATIDVWAVTVSKSANPASGSAVLAGQTITYTVTATGGATTQPVVLTDTLSTGLTFGTVSAPGAFVAVLPAGGVVVVTMQCTVTASGLP
ncbi:MULTISPECIES: DUF7507 domain-containing protein [unclassified Variovorax]|uniref:DUF7927 domain-containing protein n=1 Tax=unclassified Variovorax TaxID=663243 RepID=UPI003ED0F010